MTQDELMYARKVTSGTTKNSIKWRACKALEKQTGRPSEFYFERFGQREVLNLVALNLGKTHFKTVAESEEALASLGFPKIENEFRQLMGSKTQKQFAEEYGIPLKTVQNWYQGVRTPPPYVLKMIEIIESKKGSH